MRSRKRWLTASYYSSLWFEIYNNARMDPFRKQQYSWHCWHHRSCTISTGWHRFCWASESVPFKPFLIFCLSLKNKLLFFEGVGKSVKQGATIGAVESVKAASEIYAPISGEIIEVNNALKVLNFFTCTILCVYDLTLWLLLQRRIPLSWTSLPMKKVGSPN